MCYVEEINHRELRNNSAQVLRRVADGETLLITNHGSVAAVIAPPPNDVLELLSGQRRLRRARRPPSALREIRRTRSSRTTKEILADVRGRW